MSNPFECLPVVKLTPAMRETLSLSQHLLLMPMSEVLDGTTEDPLSFTSQYSHLTSILNEWGESEAEMVEEACAEV